jgi:hypothetical protein
MKTRQFFPVMLLIAKDDLCIKNHCREISSVVPFTTGVVPAARFEVHLFIRSYVMIRKVSGLPVSRMIFLQYTYLISLN